MMSFAKVLICMGLLCVVATPLNARNISLNLQFADDAGLYKRFVEATAQFHFSLVDKIQDHFKTDVYVYDAVGYFTDVPYSTDDTIRYQLKNDKIGMLSMAGQKVARTADEFRTLFQHADMQTDDVGVYLKYIKN